MVHLQMLIVIVAATIWPVVGTAQRALRAVRDLTIDQTQNDLSVVGQVAVSVSGIIAVFQPQDMVIRFFSPAGVFLGTFGRDGEGNGSGRRWSPKRREVPSALSLVMSARPALAVV